MCAPASPHFSSVVADLNREGVGLIEQVRALDAMTVEFRLSEAFPGVSSLHDADAPGAQALISPAAIRESRAPWLRRPGARDRGLSLSPPFRERRRIRRGTAPQRLLLDGPPAIEGIEFLPLPDLHDRVRALVEVWSTLRTASRVRTCRCCRRAASMSPHSPPLFWYLVFNQRDGRVADVRVRQAIAHAIDRKSLCDELFPSAALPAATAIPPGAPAHDPQAFERYPYDPVRARALLAQAGASQGMRLQVVGARLARRSSTEVRSTPALPGTWPRCVGADPILTHPADPILTRGWTLAA